GWSSNGRLLLLAKPGSLSALELPPGGSGHPTDLLLDAGAGLSAQFFPSGKDSPRWFAYSSTESGASQVYVQAMPGQPPGKWQASTGGGAAPQWRADGRELFYTALDRTVMAVDVRISPVFQLGVPHALFKAPDLPAGVNLAIGQYYAVSADG